jgi:manganese transport protein
MASQLGSASGTWKKMGAFLGSSIMLALGYCDPGNWATDVSAGSQFGFRHLFIILLSSLIAIYLQTLCLRIGIVTGKDLAAGCRERYSKPAGFLLWVSAEIAIAATDMAEVIGSAVALKLLFGLPTIAGVWVSYKANASPLRAIIN